MVKFSVANETAMVGLQMQASMIQGVLGELRDNSVALSAVSSDLNNLKSQVTLISKIVKDGNGQPALTTQCAMLVEAVSDLEVALKEAEKKILAQEEESKKNTRERRGQNLQFYGTLITAIIAMMVSIMTLVWK